jgi:hypothetical protein
MDMKFFPGEKMGRDVIRNGFFYLFIEKVLELRIISQIIDLSLCIGFQGLGLLHKTFTSFSILISGLFMLYCNFYYIFSCYLPLT